MKCDRCNGQGFSVIAKWKCPVCDGKGVVEPLTEQEYIQTCNTEQLADVLSDYYLMGVSHGINGMDITPRTKFVERLKQPHTPFS